MCTWIGLPFCTAGVYSIDLSLSIMTSFNLISNVSIMFGFTTLPFSSTKKLTFILPLSSHQLIVGSERVMSSIVRFSGFFTIGA